MNTFLQELTGGSPDWIHLHSIAMRFAATIIDNQ
jgi:hypothetical protein